MTYRAIGLMSGSSLDGLDIVLAEFDESGGNWNYTIKAAECVPYNSEWTERLRTATSFSGLQYQLLHAEYGSFIGNEVNGFIERNGLQHQVQLVSSHGHTTFHLPASGMTAQLGEGAAIAAATGINVVSDLRALDVAFGGQGAPIVPIGEKLLWNEYNYFLNIGGIANVSYNSPDGYIAFDVCAANRVLNMLSQLQGMDYDAKGELASSGKINTVLLTKLNALDYYKKPYPKSLANSFGIEEVYPLVQSFNLDTADALRTYVEHIAMQVGYSLQAIKSNSDKQKMLVTGGGAFNSFLVKRIKDVLKGLSIEVVVPDDQLINYKEAIVMALIGVLRWREEYNVLHTVTGARRSSIGGAVWIGQEA